MVPFAFCYNPAMMLQGNIIEVLEIVFFAIVGVAVMSAGFQGWLLWRLNILERWIFIVGGLLMFVPELISSLIGLAIVILLIVINMRKWKTAKTTA